MAARKISKTASRKTSKTASRKKSKTALRKTKTAPRKKASSRKAPTRSASKKARGTSKKVATRKTATTSRTTAPKKWSAAVTEHSDAMDLQEGVFKGRNPHKIALSIKHSAEESDRKKGNAYQSAMSMLTFYINRAGDNLTPARRKVLESAKGHLRDLFGKED